METEVILVTALTGGFAGAIATLSIRGGYRYWNRPILEIDCRNNEPGCIVDTPAWLTDSVGNVSKDKLGNPRSIQQRYLRLKITNRGRTFGKSASVCVTKITHRKAGSGDRVFAEEVFDLKLALTKDRAVFNLASGGHRFVDLVHTSQEPDCPVELMFDFVIGAARLPLLGFGPGEYEMTVFLTAENAQSISTDLKWSWDGTLNGINIDGA